MQDHKITEYKIGCVIVFNSELNSAIVEKVAYDFIRQNAEKIKKTYTEVTMGKAVDSSSTSELKIVSIARITIDLYMGSKENVVFFKGDIEAGLVRSAKRYNDEIIEEMIERNCLEADAIKASKEKFVRQVRLEFGGTTNIRDVHIPNKNDIRIMVNQKYDQSSKTL